ncbi:unnamed protein product [Cyprideis torosa]|uniref:DNA helicase n=1 Tax=Cyprideis torosa TaxID=163714 RepID=A0A7R8W6R1_9CRUS|nr:unnamed protein product [Cyprideis torosa]CAG0885489.1 unnamed protein product [Cyprideis torosa]
MGKPKTDAKGRQIPGQSKISSFFAASKEGKISSFLKKAKVPIAENEDVVPSTPDTAVCTTAPAPSDSTPSVIKPVMTKGLKRCIKKTTTGLSPVKKKPSFEANSGNKTGTATRQLKGLLDCLDADASIEQDGNKRPQKEEQPVDEINFADDDDELLANLSCLMSPKKNSQPEARNVVALGEKATSSDVAESSTQPSSMFFRFVVTAAIRPPDSPHELVLDLSSNSKCPAVKQAKLKGFWAQSAINPGTPISLYVPHPEVATVVVSDIPEVNSESGGAGAGPLIVYPDKLLSGTQVVKAAFLKNVQTEEEVSRIFDEELNSKDLLLNMYAVALPPNFIREEALPYLPVIATWIRDNNKQFVVHDIEENVWEPRLGLKGKIDVTLRQRSDGKLLPLELKTGKSSFSSEHRGQVTLYASMMKLRKKRTSCVGRVLYLRDGKSEDIEPKENELVGLYQMRNELATALASPLVHIETPNPENKAVEFRVPPLPWPPISHERACSKCQHLLTCSIYQRHVDHAPPPEAGHPMSTLVPSALSHLGPEDFEFFCRQLAMTELEDRVEADNQARAWTQDSADRERRGEAFAELVLDQTFPVRLVAGEGMNRSDAFLHQFVRMPNASPGLSPDLRTVGISLRSYLVASTEDLRQVGFARPILAEVQDKAVKVYMEKDVSQDPELSSCPIRMDSCLSQGSKGICLANLLSLMKPENKELREIAVRRRPSQLIPGSTKDIVAKARPILKGLNRLQQRAVFKALLAKDYALIRGTPGCGKTRVVVSLVRLCLAMGQSVLLTSHTHSAVDNILLRLRTELCGPILRLGNPNRIHPDLMEFADHRQTEKFTEVGQLKRFYDSVKIVATTCLAIKHPLFSRRTNPFDICIVDEASQVQPLVALGPLLLAKKFVLVADPQQLPPLVKSKEAR